MNIMCPHVLGWDLLSPIGRSAFRSAGCHFDNEGTSVLVELKSKQVNCGVGSTAEMRERTAEPFCPQDWYHKFLQGGDHLVPWG